VKDAAGPFWIPTGHLFTTRDGLPLNPRNFHRAFKARSAKAGVRAIPVHGTRHTCGSLLAALDVHPRVASQILRHSKIAVTMEIDTHIPSDLTQTALHRLGDQLEGPGEQLLLSTAVRCCCTSPPRITKALIPDRERAFDLRFHRWS